MSFIPIDPPGTILLEEFIQPSGMTLKAVSEKTGIDIVKLIAGKQLTVDDALKLAESFDTSPELWLRLQSDYDERIKRSSLW